MADPNAAAEPAPQPIPPLWLRDPLHGRVHLHPELDPNAKPIDIPYRLVQQQQEQVDGGVLPINLQPQLTIVAGTQGDTEMASQGPAASAASTPPPGVHPSWSQPAPQIHAGWTQPPPVPPASGGGARTGSGSLGSSWFRVLLIVVGVVVLAALMITAVNEWFFDDRPVQSTANAPVPPAAIGERRTGASGAAAALLALGELPPGTIQLPNGGIKFPIGAPYMEGGLEAQDWCELDAPLRPDLVIDTVNCRWTTP